MCYDELSIDSFAAYVRYYAVTSESYSDIMLIYVDFMF